MVEKNRSYLTKEASINLEAYQKFISNRIENSKDDHYKLADFLAESKKINQQEALDRLDSIKEKILKILNIEKGKNVAFVTTFHLLPWEFYYYILAYQRIKKSVGAFKMETFSYPIWYMDAKKEKSDSFNFFDTKIKIEDIFNNLDKKLAEQKKEIETSYNYYEYLKERFFKLFNIDKFDNDERKKILEIIDSAEFKEKLKNLINFLKSNQTINKKKFLLGFSEDEIEEVFNIFLKKFFLLIFDFFNFFENKIKVDEKIKKFNEVVRFLLEEENIKEILEKLEIPKENILEELEGLDDMQKLKKSKYLKENIGKLIFLTTILANGVHIGAEWPKKDHYSGKFNEIRKKLNLKPLVEFKEGIFAERFQFSEPYLDSLSLSLIFEKPEIVLIFSLKGKRTKIVFDYERFRKPIMVYDFYIKFKQYLEIKSMAKEEIFDLRISKEEIKDIFRLYYDLFIRKSDISEIVKINLEDINYNMSLREAMLKFNEKIDKKYRILEFQLKKILAIYLLKCYLQGEGSIFYNDFLNKTKEVETIEKSIKKDELIKVPKVSFSEMLEIIYLRDKI